MATHELLGNLNSWKRVACKVILDIIQLNYTTGLLVVQVNNNTDNTKKFDNCTLAGSLVLLYH